MLIVEYNEEAKSYMEREPGEDTYVYIKGDGNITDWSGKTWTAQNLAYETSGDLTYIKFNGTSGGNGLYTTSYKIPCPLTYNLRIYAIGGIYGPRLLDNTDSNDNAIQINYNNRSTIYVSPSDTGYVLPKNTRVNLCITLDSSGNVKVYSQGEEVYSGTGRRTNSANGMIIGFKKSNNSDYFQGRMSRIIIEEKIWTSDEASDYHKKTKKYYGY